MKPFVSICTPTFNRRPFVESMIQCFNHQIYPAERMEWVIIDDGTDSIEDLVSTHPRVRYFRFNEQMTLGKKRNLMHEKASGEIIVYMDDDDYYPPERVSHAVDSLIESRKKGILFAGSSEMYIYYRSPYFKMVKFGPYGENHATAATFAFWKEALKKFDLNYDETECVAEEKHFLKGYTVPMIQLDPLKVILVFSHEHNTFDKRMLLSNVDKINSKSVTSNKKVTDFIENLYLYNFYMFEMDVKLSTYQPGNPCNKPEVLKQIENKLKKKQQIYKEQEEQPHNQKNIYETMIHFQMNNENQNMTVRDLIQTVINQHNKLEKMRELLKKKFRENSDIQNETNDTS